ncbi:MAG: type II toxin-antitoxin system RelE/ParE family toxin [Saprospiraceae bacterium]
MVFEISFHPEAELELAEAVGWYENQQEGLGFAFWEDYLKVRNRLQNTPAIFPTVYDGIRRANFRKFPYSIFFSLVEQSILIFAVFHQKREPEDWFERVI